MARAGSPLFLDSTYISVNIQHVLYGVELVLYVETVHIVITLQKRGRADVLLVLFNTVMLILVTISICSSAVYHEAVCRVTSDHPGGSAAYWGSKTTVWYMTLGRGAIFMLQLMSDAQLIHRCWVIWNSTRVVIVPLILWFATLGLGVAQNWMFGTVVHTYLPPVAFQIALTYLVVCVSLNATLTSMICYRLIRQGKLVRAELGHEHSLVYFSVAETIVQSMLPYSLTGIAYLIALGVKSEALNVFSWTYFMIMCISPQMLILRVLKTKRVQQDTSEFPPASNIIFQPLSEVQVQGDDEDEVTLHLQPLSRVHSVGPGDTKSALDGGRTGGSP